MCAPRAAKPAFVPGASLVCDLLVTEPVHPESRLEHKFLIDRRAAGRVLGAARAYLKVEVYDAERPVAYARTVYLDTPDGRYLRSIDQPARLRLRLRQYASAVDLVDAPIAAPATFLELKRSAGLEGHKIRIEMSAEQAIELASGRVPDPVAARLADHPGFAGIALDLESGLLAPAATTWYRRLSLTGDGVRLTFDEAIAFCLPSHPVLPGELAEPSGTRARERRTVVELKTAGPIPAALAGTFARLSPAPAYSKFHAAMVAASPARSRRDGTLPLPVLS